jgi:hypothetical protein
VAASAYFVKRGQPFREGQPAFNGGGKGREGIGDEKHIPKDLFKMM